jgi:hypothetical protein
MIDEIKFYCECGAEIKDGNFALIDGVLYCKECREKLNNALLENASKKLLEIYG